MSKSKIKPMQKLAVDNLMSGKSKTKKQAVLDAGYSEATAINATKNVFKSQGVQEYLKQFDDKALVRFEMPLEEKLQEVYLDGLDADKPYGKHGDIMPDFKIRKDYADKISEMIGLIKSRVPVAGQTFNFFMFGKSERSKFNKLFNNFVRTSSVEG